MDAVFFDMDGVLVDSELQWKLAETPLFRTLLGRWEEADHERIVGLGVEDLYGFLVREYGLKEPRERFLKLCDELAEEVYGRKVARAEGLLELLEDLRESGVPAGLASASPRRWIRRVIDRFGLEGAFRTIVSVDDVGGEGKPSPAVYLQAARLCGARPERSVAIEDSALGVLSAKRAGMACVGFRNGSNDLQDLSPADLEVRGFRELDAARLRSLVPC